MPTIPIVDVFAGPGGLGEGFAGFKVAGDFPFKILLSAEANRDAHSTLRLRAFQRALIASDSDVSHLLEYYQGKHAEPFTQDTHELWEEANQEALCLELGSTDGDKRLYKELGSRLDASKPWVLIGGPPCQAYSIAGRVRNKGNVEYVPSDDLRHFLYQEYLRIINRYRPAAFVMENVRGMLSCKIDGKLIAHQILEDLACAGDRSSLNSSQGYRIYSLAASTYFEIGKDVGMIDTKEFVVKSEEYGIPQARHRVILLGVRNDIDDRPRQLSMKRGPVVEEVISDLPVLRSGFSREGDDGDRWHSFVASQLWELACHARENGGSDFAEDLDEYGFEVRSKRLEREARMKRAGCLSDDLPASLRDWLTGRWPSACFNHETRAHMASDLRRYAYAAVFAKAHGRYPKGVNDFSLPGLAPAHENWTTGKFADRFRVQQEGRPATTITSHIAKDGHYYIHPDPSQCRSLTVREAARIQTFPDDYFFSGPRTSQYTQVGNAVPPYLARQIAEIVFDLLKKNV